MLILFEVPYSGIGLYNICCRVYIQWCCSISVHIVQITQQKNFVHLRSAQSAMMIMLYKTLPDLRSRHFMDALVKTQPTGMRHDAVAWLYRSRLCALKTAADMLSASWTILDFFFLFARYKHARRLGHVLPIGLDILVPLACSRLIGLQIAQFGSQSHKIHVVMSMLINT